MEDNKDLEKTVEEESKEVEAAEASENSKADSSESEEKEEKEPETVNINKEELKKAFKSEKEFEKYISNALVI